MCFATLLPLGIVQLFKSVGDGYFEARTVDFLFNDTNRFFEWMRLPGDIIFIVKGVLPVLYIAYIESRPSGEAGRLRRARRPLVHGDRRARRRVRRRRDEATVAQVLEEGRDVETMAVGGYVVFLLGALA